MSAAEIADVIKAGPVKPGSSGLGLVWCEEKKFESMPDIQWLWVGDGSVLSLSFKDAQLTMTAGPDVTTGCLRNTPSL